MKWNLLVVCLLLLGMAPEFCISQQMPAKQVSLDESDCFKSIFVESPVQDTYVAKDKDTSMFGLQPVMRLRAFPERKRMVAMLAYQIEHLDAQYVTSAYLKLYTATKHVGSRIVVSRLDSNIDENRTNWNNRPSAGKVIQSTSVTDAPFTLFEVTSYVKEHLASGTINFQLETDGKKVIDIASRESRLSSELIIETCTSPKFIVKSASKNTGEFEYSLEVLPSPLTGKFTIQLVGMPDDGFGDLLLMTDQGEIVQQRPIAVHESKISYHTLDIGDMLPGLYWAVLRKGRILIKDQFILRPQASTKQLYVEQAEVSTNGAKIN